MIHFSKYGLIGGLLLAAAACDAPTGETPASSGQVRIGQISFIESPQLKVLSKVQLSPGTKARFEEFKSKPNAHGAFYVASNGSGSGWQRNTATAADAQKSAKVLCEHVTKRKCVLYATLEPGPNDAPNALPLSYKKNLGPALRDTSVGRKLAIAVAPIGAYGFSWNYDVRSAAQNAALKQCEQGVKKASAEDEEPLRKAFENGGILECRVHIFY